MNPEDIPSSYLDRVAQIESRGNPAARNRASSAGGLFQITRGTWDAIRRSHPELRLTAEGRFNAAQSVRAMRALTADNARFLRDYTGKTPSNSELYLAHFLGSVGALTIIAEAPATPVRAVVSPAVIRGNPFLRSMKVRDLRAWAAAKVPDYLPNPMLTTKPLWLTKDERPLDGIRVSPNESRQRIQDGSVEPGSDLDRRIREGLVSPLPRGG